MRERIIAAFAELAAQKGFSKITMDELALKAGISKRTIYMHFKNKEELVEVVIHQFLEEIGEKVDYVLEQNFTLEEILNNASDSIYLATRTFLSKEVLEDIQKYYPALWKKIEEYRLDIVQKGIMVLLKKSGKEYDCRIISTAFIASIEAVLNPEYLLTNGLTYEQAVNQLLDFLKYGLMGHSQ